MNINKKANLEKSFAKLKADLFNAVDKTKGNKEDKYAYAFGLLETGVKKHLIECTDLQLKDIQDEMALIQNDIPNNLFVSPKAN